MKIQKCVFSGGVFAPSSFVLHKIEGDFTGHCSAWYSPTGEIEDAEWHRRDGQVRNVPRHSPMWQHLKRLGPVWKD